MQKAGEKKMSIELA